MTGTRGRLINWHPKGKWCCTLLVSSVSLPSVSHHNHLSLLSQRGHKDEKLLGYFTKKIRLPSMTRKMSKYQFGPVFGLHDGDEEQEHVPSLGSRSEKLTSSPSTPAPLSDMTYGWRCNTPDEVTFSRPPSTSVSRVYRSVRRKETLDVSGEDLLTPLQRNGLGGVNWTLSPVPDFLRQDAVRITTLVSFLRE